LKFFVYNLGMPDWLGKTLGKVHIDLLLARGGMAEVYLGTHVGLQRAVAVKLLRNQFEDDPDLLERFEREARVVAKLRHPNIVQVFDFDAVEGRPYLVMEYIPGISLSAYLRALHEKGGRLELPVVSRLLTTLADALQYAHQSGVIHRDVKPGNILLTSRTTPVTAGKPLPADFEAILTDFGLVRFLNSNKQTAAGQIAGTPAYMSPEQARGDQTDERTDIYSLAIVLYEILAGHVPFDADTTMSVLLKQMNEPPAPIPDLAPDLQRVLDRGLAKQTADRYQSPKEFAAAFQEAVDHQADEATLLKRSENAGTIEMLSAESGSSLRTWIPAFLAAGAVILITALFTLRPLLAPPPAPTEDPSHPHVESPAAGTPYAEPAPEKIALLRFQDGAARVDQVSLTGLAMPAAPQGSQYEAWLVGGEERRSLGLLALDEQGKGSLKFVDSQGRNLLSLYDTVEITLEPNPDPSPNPSGDQAYAFRLPPDGLLHVRHVLVAFGKAPNGSALIQGLMQDSRLVDDSAQIMLAAYQSGDEAGMRRQAEAILNVLVGNQSPDHKDWDGDGLVSDPGDGYGMLLNGDNLGYIQGSYSHADFAVTSPDATPNMVSHGNHTKICTQNMEEWAPQLRDLIKQVLGAPFGPEMEGPLRQSVALADELLKGTDLNGDEKVDPVPGEGGATTAYAHAYYMADMTIYEEVR
jgi:serine/threonine protein kinase